MTRSLKAAGLALVAMLAVSAVAASAASAKPVLTPVPEEYPVSVEARQVGNHKLALPGNRNLECSTVEFKGTIASKTDAAKGEVTITPTYAGCTMEILGVKNPATVTPNGCDYKFTTDSTEAIAGFDVKGSLHIECPNENDKIEVHAWQPGKNHATDPFLCTYTIGEQSAGSLYYRLDEKDGEGNGTSGTIRAAVTGIDVTRSSGTLTNCGAAAQQAEYTGDAKFEWFNDQSEMLKVKVEEI